MKITKKQLRKIIQEEMRKALDEYAVQDRTGSGLNVPAGWFKEPAPAKWCADGYKGNLCGDGSPEEYVAQIGWLTDKDGSADASQLKMVLPDVFLYRAKKLSPEGAVYAGGDGYKHLIALAHPIADKLDATVNKYEKRQGKTLNRQGYYTALVGNIDKGKYDKQLVAIMKQGGKPEQRMAAESITQKVEERMARHLRKKK
tara:strand:+ start:82 stop:681 length:600 start_codon:yes stop_codon:yes gene_type:complete